MRWEGMRSAAGQSHVGLPYCDPVVHRCESCGQEVSESSVHTHAVWLDSDDEGAANTDSGHSGPAGGDSLDGGDTAKHGDADSVRSGRDRKLLAVVVGAIAVWAAFIGISRIVTPDDAIDQAAAEDLARAAAEREAEAIEAEQPGEPEEFDSPEDGGELNPSPSGAYTAADAAPGFPAVEEAARLLADLGAESDPSSPLGLLQRDLVERGIAPIVVYEARGGLVMIDLVEGAVLVRTASSRSFIERGVSEVGVDAFDEQERNRLSRVGVDYLEPNVEIFRSGPVTYAIDPITLGAVRLFDDGSMIVVVEDEPVGYVVPGSSLARRAALVSVLWQDTGESFRAPNGFQLFAADGLGLLAVPMSPTGATRIASPAAFVQLSEFRIITANSAARLEQVCVTETDCALSVTANETGDAWDVSPNFVRLGDQFVLSPDGLSLVRFSPEGFGELFLSHGPVTTWINGAGVEAPTWSPSSDFIAWLDRVGGNELKLLFPDDRGRITLPLDEWDLPLPISADLLIFERDEIGASS